MMDIASIQARLDVLFANLFVPGLGINVRFVGTEPYCPVTNAFNEAMKEILLPGASNSGDSPAGRPTREWWCRPRRSVLAEK